ncbi:uncharacterized protein LOC127522253 [Ctenopharyngodon idella]|uniref:uncharacterized protein LOC127522253 n=1 Tax=Ctenopharyngodon idella TaxID=7959 RepID=UPI00222E0C2C|nr:uncharacterized protein LOC127522253 [Ctenopharyngodon idella]
MHVINRHSSPRALQYSKRISLRPTKQRSLSGQKLPIQSREMSTKLRKCRRSLAAALDQAAEEDSSWSPNSVFSLSLVRISQNGTYVYDHWTERPDCMCFGKEDFLCCTRSAILQDLHGLLDIQTLEDLVAKLEFENELNRVCSRSLQSKNPESSFNQEESANSDMEEGSTDRWAHDSKEEYSFLLDTILEIERDNDFTADCDVSSLELDLQFSP